jgi:hypothetical protein
VSTNYSQPISTTVQSISTAVALVTPQTNYGYQPVPTDGAQPPALLFHYEGENVVHLQSDITDHFVEDNTAIQDQISLKPEKITVHGFIGELNNVSPLPIPNNGQISAILPDVASFVPAFTTAGQAAIDQASAAYQTALVASNTAVSAWGALTGNNGQTVIGSSGVFVSGASLNLQQAMFQQFYGYWLSRTLFNVQTPWAVFTNMAIEELRATQDESTRVITDFYVSFKMIRFSSLTEEGETLQPVGRAGYQSQPLDDLGVSSTTPSISLASAFSLGSWN